VSASSRLQADFWQEMVRRSRPPVDGRPYAVLEILDQEINITIQCDGNDDLAKECRYSKEVHELLQMELGGIIQTRTMVDPRHIQALADRYIDEWWKRTAKGTKL